MEKRFVTFIVLSMLILIGYQVLDSKLNPRPQGPGDAEMAAADGEQGPAKDQDDQPNAPPSDPDSTGAEGAQEEPSDAQPDAEVPEAERKASKRGSGESDDAASGEGAAEASQFQATPRRVAIGSLDPNAPVKLLVWFTTKGASIECVALNDKRYNDLERHYGYLGFLALDDVPTGCRIGAVGDGTPADKAGLQAGDLVVAADDRPIQSEAQFRQWLESTRPGQSVRVTVDRGDTEVSCVATLRKYPLEVIRPEWTQAPAVPSDHPLSYRLGLHRIGDTELAFDEDELPGLPSLKTRHWQLQPIDPNRPGQVEFHYVLTAADLESSGVEGPLRVVKRFRIAKTTGDKETAPDEAIAVDGPDSAFHLHYEIEFRNEAAGGDPITFAYQQDGPTGLPLEGWWYTYKTHPTQWGAAGVRDVVTKSFAGNYKMFTNPSLVSRLDETPQSPAISMYEDEPPQVQFAGVDAQYFVSAIVASFQPSSQPSDYLFEDALAMPIPPKNETKSSRTDVTFRLVSRPVTLGNGESHKQQFLIFAGPKKSEVLEEYGLSECITYGWFPWVAKPLTWILHGVHAVFRNYGIAIIMLTALVRSCMFPLGRKQALNAQKMQELAPEMRTIAEKYKNDMEKRAAAQRELFQKHNYNPLAGCLPMFVQLPIFIGLYRALSVDIELRQAPLIPGIRWCSNLAGPDQLIYWESFMPQFLAGRTGWLGPYLNILPLVTVALMMVHQKLFTPPPTDEQQVMQHKMMKYMMLFFGFMFFRVPSGLCVYFITSNLWSVGERKLLPKRSSSEQPPPSTRVKTKSVRGKRSQKKR